MDHKEQYQSYLAQAMSALEHACALVLIYCFYLRFALS